ncbi:hypothetical protein [Bythopirellula goksoeyrii]|uniref:Uncharacterized protein n=1 Tax=Bythopirellula goksoeyrii TaxID=1400387 RepID=A0A5B9QJU9_9BACT|nr:hypothetical protein [Bythopirellula goksoeyrii]QEG34373.1 hypothetical protein Pr1d_16490 [Bythopirellula goksoeyrii]
MRLYSNMIALLLATVWCPTVAAQESIPADDHQNVYRLTPRDDNTGLVLVPPSEIKPGYAYYFYSSVLKRRVWGFATEENTFEYAFGEGTILPTSRFDLRLSEQDQERILEERVPRLKQDIEGLGRSPAAQLDASGNWKLLSYTTSARVFDMLTSERWEWHGKRRLGVVNVYGNLWQIVDGEYVPLVMGWAVCQ